MTELPIVVNMTVDASRTEYDLTAESNLEEIELLNDTVIETGGSHVPVYEGPYTVDAGLTAVTLDTDGKRLTQDVTVNALQENDITGNSLTINTSTGKVSSLVSISRGYSPLVFGVTNSLQLSTQARATITPTASEQTAVARGKYTTGVVKVRAISSPYADVSGVTATAGDVLSGKYFVDSSGVLTLGTGGGGMDAETKDALLECFEHVAWIDNTGDDCYDNLLNVLYTLQSISAVYTQSSAVFADTPLDDLRDDLVVTASFEDGEPREITNYLITGTLTTGTSTMTVTYYNKTTTFNVIVSQLYQITNNLTFVTNSNTDTDVIGGSSYTGTLTAASGYELTTVTVTMGGIDVTSTVYSNGVINIASVTGNIVITATATTSSPYDFYDAIALTSSSNLGTGNGLLLPNYMTSGDITSVDDMQLEFEMQQQVASPGTIGILAGSNTSNASEITGLKFLCSNNGLAVYAHGVNVVSATGGGYFAEVQDLKKHVVKYQNNGTSPFTLSVDDTVKTINWSTSPGHQVRLGVGYCNCLSNTTQSSNNSKVKIGYIKIWNSSGTLLNHFVPAKRKADNAIGLYDSTKDEFITPTTQGNYALSSWTAV